MKDAIGKILFFVLTVVAKKAQYVVRVNVVGQINAPEQGVVPRMNSYVEVDVLHMAATVVPRLVSTAIVAIKLLVLPLQAYVGAMELIRMQKMPNVPTLLIAVRGKDDTNNLSEIR